MEPSDVEIRDLIRIAMLEVLREFGEPAPRDFEATVAYWLELARLDQSESMTLEQVLDKIRKRTRANMEEVCKRYLGFLGFYQEILGEPR